MTEDLVLLSPELFDATCENWWAERGSIRYVWNEDSLTTVIAYVLDTQDRKVLVIPTRRVSEGPPTATRSVCEANTHNIVINPVPRSRFGLRQTLWLNPIPFNES